MTRAARLPDHEVRRIEMVAWLATMHESIEEQAPTSPGKRCALALLDGWIDDLPTYARLRH